MTIDDNDSEVTGEIAPQHSVRVKAALWKGAMKKARAEYDVSLSELINAFLESFMDDTIRFHKSKVTKRRKVKAAAE